METTLRDTERTYVKLIGRSFAALLLLVLLFWGGARAYHEWQLRRALHRATTALSAGDIRAASLSARRAYQLKPTSPAAARILAQIAEDAGERAALDWRRNVVQLDPTSAPDQIALAQTALRFEDLGTAQRALAAVSDAGQTAAYYAAAARLAAAKREPAKVREHWAKAVELAPGNRSYQVELAAATLALPEATGRESALAALEKLRKEPTERAAATRALILDGMSHRRNPAELVALGRELKGYPNAPFADVLLYLDLLRRTRHTDFTSQLTEVEAGAANRPDDLARLLSWMNKSGLSALALDYTRSLAPDVLAKWPVPLALADSYMVAGNWLGLEQWAGAHSWGSLDFLRHAYLARAFREQGQTVAADREWNVAKKEASKDPRMLSLLTRTMIGWQWTEQAVDLLWTLTKDSAEQEEALRSLYRHYSATGDTAGLYRTLVRLVEVMPDDLALQNNLAQIGLLLDADRERARKLAADLHQKKPDEPAYVSTYAFSLFSNGDAAGAVRAMQSLGEEKLREPSLAAYYGIFLASAGEAEKAREYLKLGAGARLLPEEKALLEKAEGKAN